VSLPFRLGGFLDLISTLVLEKNKQIDIIRNKILQNAHDVTEVQNRVVNTALSEVQRVKLSRRSCMIKVLSLYDSSPRESSSAIASSNAYKSRHRISLILDSKIAETIIGEPFPITGKGSFKIYFQWHEPF
jgi:hypothetical protein